MYFPKKRKFSQVQAYVPTKQIAKSRRGRRQSIARRTSYYGPAGDAKYIDIAASNYGLDTTGAVTHLSVVPQGSTVNERDGKAFILTSIAMRGRIYTGTGTNVTQYGAYIVWDKQPNKALAGVTDILDSASSISFNKRENSGRFIIIKKLRGVLSGESDNTAITGPNIVDVDEYVKLPRTCVCECTGADTTGEIANRISGALLLVTVGINAAGVGAPTLAAAFRVNFKDI